MAEETKQTKGNGKLRVSRNIIDLIKGLRTLNDLDNVYWFLEHLKLLSRLIDDIASDDVPYDIPGISIASLAFYQQWLIGKIQDVLNAQDMTIATLQRIVHKAEEAAGIVEEKDLTLDDRKLEALRSLGDAFDDSLCVRMTTNRERVKAWALSYGFDFEAVKQMIAARQLPD